MQILNIQERYVIRTNAISYRTLPINYNTRLVDERSRAYRRVRYSRSIIQSLKNKVRYKLFTITYNFVL